MNKGVKNRAAAPIQITAEQILREAQERQEEAFKPTQRTIVDAEELADYRLNKRKEFETAIRQQRQHIGTWMKYAKWEESQQEFRRARSVYERAIDVEYTNPTIWLKYAEMEMRHKFINHARNVWDRAVTLLPRVSQLWYKYAFMEEMVENLDGARRVFERWMEWEPDDQAWFSYIKLELRADEVERARQLYERYLLCHPKEEAYMKYAKWEERQQHQIALARTIYERALVELREDEISENLYSAFAAFEERYDEIERARGIFQYALDRLPKERATKLYNAFIAFEKQHGERKKIEDVVIAKRRIHYEEVLKENPLDYDTWFDYLKLEEAEQNVTRIREVYERAVANVPPLEEKQYWRRYIYFWIKYAIYEELVTDETERAKQVYKQCLDLVPHKKFTFSKIWILYAKFLIRQRDLNGARLALGQAIGRCPTRKLYRNYIQIENNLGEVDRCRKLYEKFLLFEPQNCDAWNKYAQLEKRCGEVERARAIYELAVKQPALDMPEMIWKAYIDFELENKNIEATRILYERLLERTTHVKVWISFATFEGNQNDPEMARDVYNRAARCLKEEEKKEERAMVLESWLKYEEGLEGNSAANITKVRKMQPRKVQKQRMAYSEDGTELGMEEYTDYIFPDDESSLSNLKLLQAAAKWKKRPRTEDA